MQLIGMGFEEEQAAKAFVESGNNEELAANLLID